VAITGLGLICASGNTVAESWTSMQAGVCSLATIQSVDTTPYKFHQGGEVRAFDPVQHFEPKHLDLLDRFAQFVLVAAREAVKESGVDFEADMSARAAVITGTGAGGFCTVDEQWARPRMHPLTIPRTMASAGASHIAMDFGITGPAFTVSSACSSSNHAIGQAFWMVRNGQADVALAGGSEAPFTAAVLRGWDALRVVSPDTCRPFSRDRRGLLLGEGGGVMVLEPLDHARARGAKILGEIAGFGMSSDAAHITQPAVSGPTMAMQAALKDAGIAPKSVGYINAHGTGTTLNDATEASAIRQVFGTHPVAVSSTKSMHGHAIGGAGAIEAVATVLALRDGVLPPTVNYSERDPQIDLDLVVASARQAQCEYALSNSFAFGGLNAVLVFRRGEEY
jgi:nodulation protein E